MKSRLECLVENGEKEEVRAVSIFLLFNLSSHYFVSSVGHPPCSCQDSADTSIDYYSLLHAV